MSRVQLDQAGATPVRPSATSGVTGRGSNRWRGQMICGIACLDTADECEHLVRCTVKGVQRETKLRMCDERKEAERAVMCPLQDDGLPLAPHDRFDERRPFANDLDLVTSIEQSRTINIPCRSQGRSRVVKEIETLRNPWRVEDRIQCGATGDIALARRNPLPRYEAADFSLNVRESHSSIFPAR